MLQVSNVAPVWTAVDQDGKSRSLSEYRGKWVFLYFYPKDDTPGCTAEACGLRDSFEELQRHAEIIGVSADSQESHRKFREKYGLPFTLLADTGRTIINAYGANGMIFGKRVSFLINPDGVIAKVYSKIDCERHAQEVLSDLRAAAVA